MLERKLHESKEFVCFVNEHVSSAGDSIWIVMLNTHLGKEWLNECEDFKSLLQHRSANQKKFKKYLFRVWNENVGGALPVLNKIIRNCMQWHGN